MPDNSQTRPDKVGNFSIRGGETTRLETFVDAAFALTLLVISFDAVPASYAELVIALRAIPAFLFGFVILMMFWMAHRKWSIRYGLDTTAASLISLTLVFIVLVYVYPLRAISTAAVSAFTNGWLPTSFEVRTTGELRGLFAIYGSGFCLCAVCIVFLNLHALNERNRLGLSPEEVVLTRSGIYSWLLVSGTGVASIILAVTLPPGWLGLSGWLYASLGVLMPFHEWLTARRFDRQFSATADSS